MGHRTIPYAILYEDEDLIAINKPHSIHSVMLPASSLMGESVAEHLVRAHPELSKVSDKPEDAGFLHRLDFPTSGVLVAAKNRGAWKGMRTAAKEGLVEKQYLALVEKQWVQIGVVEGFLGCRGRHAKKMRFHKTRRGASKERLLPVATYFEPLHHWPSDNVTLIRATLAEGRRHQIRAMLSGLGHPLVGDKLYGSVRTLSDLAPATPYTLPEFFLHAHVFSFPHPRRKTRMSVHAPIPEYISTLSLTFSDFLPATPLDGKEK